MVNALVMEGDPYLRASFLENEIMANKALVAKDVLDGIYFLQETDLEPDVIIIGDELDMSVPGLESKSYFPIDLGNLFRKICKDSGKKVPKIVVWTIMEGYDFVDFTEFGTKRKNAIYNIARMNGMQVIDKCSTDKDRPSPYKQLVNLFLE